MKAITLHQPWASLIAKGIKEYETRSFQISHRGRLAIHAAKTRRGLRLYQDSQRIATPSLDLDNLPYGKIVCVVTLAVIHETGRLKHRVSPLEETLGDWTPGRYAWRLDLIEKFKDPIPAIGRQGLWNWDEEGLHAGD